MKEAPLFLEGHSFLSINEREMGRAKVSLWGISSQSKNAIVTFTISY
jgi:hypothetical protein